MGNDTKPMQMSGLYVPNREMEKYSGKMLGLDINKCRSNALEQCARPLPVFCVVDDWEDLEGYKPGFDFYEVEGRPRWCERVEEDLFFKRIQPQDIKLACKATGSVQPERFSQACDALRQSVHEAYERCNWYNDGGEMCDPPDKFAKGLVLKAIGTMNRTDKDQVTWTVTESDFSDDHHAPITQRRRRVGEAGPEWEFMSEIQHKSCVMNFRPLGQIALDMEIMRVQRAEAWVKRHPLQYKLLGVQVDCVMFAPLVRKQTQFELALKDRYADGSLVYKVVKEFKQVPAWPLRPQEPATGLGGPAKLHWRTQGSPLEGGAFIAGPPGTGKTFYMQELARQLRADCYEVLEMAYTHSAAHNLGGEKADTVMHFLHSHKRGLPNAAKTWIQIDKLFQVPLKLIPRLVNFMWLGVRFIIGGDFNQQLPIGEVWGHDAALRLEHSAVLHHMCNGLRLDFAECRRSDAEHFGVYTSIPKTITDMDVTVSFLMDQYPWDGEEIDVVICIGHKLREALAQRLNKRQAERARVQGLEVVLVKPRTEPKLGTSMAPHPEMRVFKGLRLTGSRRDSVKNYILNGCSYVAVSVDEEKVVARLESGTSEIALTHQQCIQDLRLACARTYAGIQGLTLRDQRLLLLQTRHPFMEWRKLYVACSRVTSGKLLHIPTPEQERVPWSLGENIFPNHKRPAPELEVPAPKVQRFLWHAAASEGRDKICSPRPEAPAG